MRLSVSSVISWIFAISLINASSPVASPLDEFEHAEQARMDFQNFAKETFCRAASAKDVTGLNFFKEKLSAEDYYHMVEIAVPFLVLDENPEGLKLLLERRDTDIIYVMIQCCLASKLEVVQNLPGYLSEEVIQLGIGVCLSQLKIDLIPQFVTLRSNLRSS